MMMMIQFFLHNLFTADAFECEVNLCTSTRPIKMEMRKIPSYLMIIFFIDRWRSVDNFNEKLPHKITNVTQINDQ